MSDFLTGVRYFGRGLGWVAKRPRQWAFGLIPALIVLIVYGVALGFLAAYDWDLAKAVTPFADGWAHGLRDTTRVLAAILLLGAAAVLAVVTFTAVTLVVGEPFYESLSTRVETSVGGAPPEPSDSLWRQVWRGLGDGLVVGLMTLVFALVFFVLGFLPAVGQTVVPVLAACVGGYFLTLELTAIAMERRGMRRRDRFAALRANRALSVGFGVTVFVVFLIPLGAVLAMPGAVAGATLMARERLTGQGIRGSSAVPYTDPV